MAIQLDIALVQLINNPETVKVLATVDEKGAPHVVFKSSLWANDRNQLLYLEFLESSRTNKNMVRSIWFNHTISVTVLGTDGTAYQIKGKPVKSVVAGTQFREHYVRIQKELGDVDLAAVWIIEPETVTNQTLATRRQHEEAARPYFKHLDRLAK